MDSFPMVALCANQQSNTTFALYAPKVAPTCPDCGDPMWWSYKQCSGCTIKEINHWREHLGVVTYV